MRPCVCQGKPFCRCWVHNAFVNVDGEKMSKSKGNFLTLKSTLETALDVRAFRYLVVSSQYRTTLGFSKKSLEGAKNTVRRLDKLRVRLRPFKFYGWRLTSELLTCAAQSLARTMTSKKHVRPAQPTILHATGPKTK